VLTRDETIETTSAWEVKVPLGLLIFGLAILVIHGLMTQGARGGAMMLLGIGVLLLVYLPITIAAMFIAAPLVDVTFGEFGPAVLKIAGIYVFTSAIQDVTATTIHPALGWALGLGASLALFGKAFELTFGEAAKAVFVIAAVRGLLAFAIATLLPHQARDEAPAPNPRPAGQAAGRPPRSIDPLAARPDRRLDRGTMALGHAADSRRRGRGHRRRRRGSRGRRPLAPGPRRASGGAGGGLGPGPCAW
jgi:hypothetical protein